MSKNFVKGATVGAIVASVVMLSVSAWAGTGIGAVFNLGATNTVNASTKLSGTTSAKILDLTNKGGGQALGLTVAAGKAPLAVNSNSGTATNLSADKLDGLHASAFQRVPRRIYASTTSPNTVSAGTAGPWSFSLHCGAGGPGNFTITGPGQVGGTTSIANGGSAGATYVGGPGSIGGGATSAVGEGAQMGQDLFLQNGSTIYEVHLLLTASNGGLFTNCLVIGEAVQIS